jgi:hypothetical protein
VTPQCIHHQGVDLNWFTKKPTGEKYTRESRPPYDKYTEEYLLPVLFVTRKVFWKSVPMLIPTSPRSRLSDVFTTGESRFPHVFFSGGVVLPILKSIAQSLNGLSF